MLNYLTVKTAVMTVEERFCVLTLDEMSITASVELDNRTGTFVGDVTLPGHSGTATHSLVFMLGGLRSRWKQTVAYFFTGNSTNGGIFYDYLSHSYSI